jgi:hypothetical protein
MKTVAPALALSCAVSLLATGCLHTPGGSVPSTIPLDPGGYTVVKEDVEGSDCHYAIFGLFPVRSGNRTYRAIQDAMRQVPRATALIDVTSDA